MQATLAPREEFVVPSGALPMGAAIADSVLLLFYAEPDDDARPPDEDLDEILALRCASL